MPAAPPRSSLTATALAGFALTFTSCGSSEPAASTDRPSRANATAATATETKETGERNGGVGAGRPGRASYAPWPAAGHDAAHTGTSTATGPQRGSVRWKRPLEGSVVPGPIIGNGGYAYAASNGGVLHALRVETGEDVWTFDGGSQYGSDLSTSPLLTPEGQLLWPGPGGQLYGLDATTGAPTWTLALGGQGLSPALAPNGDVIVGTTGGVVRALVLHGTSAPTIRWMVDTGGTSYGSPIVDSGGVVYTTAGEALIAIDQGRETWRVQARGQVEVGAAVAPDGTVIFGSNDQTVYAVSPAGRVRWRYPLGDLTYSSPSATRDGLVYIGDHFGRVTALSVADGRPRLVVKGAGRTPGQLNVGVWSAPAIDVLHNVYFGSHPGHVYGFDARGKRLFDVDTGALSESYPALAADGTLLIGNEAGDLFAIR